MTRYANRKRISNFNRLTHLQLLRKFYFRGMLASEDLLPQRVIDQYQMVNIFLIHTCLVTKIVNLFIFS